MKVKELELNLINFWRKVVLIFWERKSKSSSFIFEFML